MAARVVFLGNDPWSVPPLEALAAATELQPVLVLTRTARPGRRGGDPVPTPVAETARSLDLPLREIDSVRTADGVGAVTAARPDVLAVVAYGEILPREFLTAGPMGAVNVHLSLLPRWRGASPVQHALLAGDERTGVTTMLMDEGLDTGPVLEQASTPVEPEDDAGRLGDRLARMGGELLVRTLVELAAGRATPRPQDASAVTLAPKLTAEDRRLRWDRPADEVVRRVRAFSPEPGADTLRDGRVLKVLRASVTGGEAEVPPGTIVRADGSTLHVAAGDGVVQVHRVAAQGRAHMEAAEWLRGARLRSGERLG